MSERHSGLDAFDKASQHSFDTTCAQGTPLNESVFAAYGINRHVTSDGILTAYPNGVTVTRFKEGDFSIGFPDNYKHHENKDGLSTITDKKGHAVAYLSAEGNLLIPANDKVLQENKQAEVSLNDMSCFNKEAGPNHHHNRHVLVLPEITITARADDAAKTHERTKTNDHDKKKDKPLKKDAPKPNAKPFNWNSDDPLEGMDATGY